MNLVDESIASKVLSWMLAKHHLDSLKFVKDSILWTPRWHLHAYADGVCMPVCMCRNDNIFRTISCSYDVPAAKADTQILACLLNNVQESDIWIVNQLNATESIMLAKGTALEQLLVEMDMSVLE